MRLHVLAVGDRPPRWVGDACAEFLERFPPHCPLYLKSVPTPSRGRNPDVNKLRDKERQLLSARIPRSAFVIALDEEGRTVTTAQISQRLDQWMLVEQDVVFLVGGPDGLAPSALDAARECWSLSALTLPHMLARVVIVEQLYRAYSMLANHPYHRAG